MRLVRPLEEVGLGQAARAGPAQAVPRHEPAVPVHLGDVRIVALELRTVLVEP